MPGLQLAFKVRLTTVVLHHLVEERVHITWDASSCGHVVSNLRTITALVSILTYCTYELYIVYH